MLCPSCTAELMPDSNLCVSCGATVDQVTSTAPPPSTLSRSTDPLSVFPQAEPATPPYALFISMALSFGLCLSVAAFNAAHNLGQGWWRVSPITLLASLAAVVLMFSMPRVWRRIEAFSDEQKHQKKLLRRSIYFVLGFMATAAIVGFEIGKDGKATAQLVLDFHELSVVRQRISDARNSVEPNIPSHLVMYKQIETDVQAFGTVLRKIQVELPAYDERFPDQHEETLKSIQSVTLGIKRAGLLEQQITVARDIEGLDPTARFQAWEHRMQPLLDAESALDNEN